MSNLSICFIDLINWDYDVSTPLDRPLGGSQSALCYLAVELAKRGNRVVVVNKGTSRGRVAGVEMVPEPDVGREFLRENQFDTVIVLNGPAEYSNLKQLLPSESVLVLWSQHASNQSAMWNLAKRKVRKKWDRIVCVGETHRRNLVARYPILPEQIEVCGNAISPAFESLFANESELRSRKAGIARLAYTSTPFRGLDILLDVFPKVNRQCQLEIYSSMKVYQIGLEGDSYRELYDKARRTADVSYVGSVSQKELAAAMARISVLAYPSTFEEMYCVSVIEAMAAGALVVATDLGALPETTLGYGDLVHFDPKGDRDEFSRRYLARLRAALDAIQVDGTALVARLYAQSQLINSAHTWRVRAIEWERKIERWKAERLANLSSQGPRAVWQQ
jgi:glycosyltransferase involved in cell wall biosynthesis